MTGLLRIAIGLPLAVGAGAQSTYVELPPTTQAAGLSADGQWLVGYEGASAQTFRWSASTGVLPLRGFDSLGAVGVGGFPVVGNYQQGPSLFARAWTPHGQIDLGTLGTGCPTSAASLANDVTSDGAIIVGQSCSPSGLLHAYQWTRPTGFLDLTPSIVSFSNAVAISPNGRYVVGSIGFAGALWRDGELVPRAPTGSLFDVNSDGVVAGSTAAGAAFVWSESAGTRRIGTLPGDVLSTLPLAISETGAVAGAVASASGRPNRAFYWTAELGIRDLRALLTDHGAPIPDGTLLGTASAISADGRVVAGEYLHADFTFGTFVATLGGNDR